MPNIAITGGIASGKSLFGQMLSQPGADVLDADEIIREMHGPGGEGAKLVARAFGRDFLSENGATNRAKLGDLVFNNPSAKRRLDALLHPPARRRALAWRNAPSRAPFKALLVPLLFESGWESDWDNTLTIESPLETRIARLAVRGLTRDAALARIAAQTTPEIRCAKAGTIVFNNSGPDALARAAAVVFKLMEQKSRT